MRERFYMIMCWSASQKSGFITNHEAFFYFRAAYFFLFSVIWSGVPNYSSWLDGLWYTTMHFHVAFINRLLPAGRSFWMSDVPNLCFQFQETMKHILERSYHTMLLLTTNIYTVLQLLGSRLLWGFIWFISPVIMLLHVTTDLLLLFPQRIIKNR